MILDTFSLERQVGIVTGGGQGLGKAFCLGFAEAAGANVVVADVNPETGPQTVEDVQKIGRRSIFVETDIRKKVSVEALVEKTVAEFGRLDFFMNNAGVALWKEAEDVAEQDWRRLMDVNLNGVYFCCQAAANHMKTQGADGSSTLPRCWDSS